MLSCSWRWQYKPWVGKRARLSFQSQSLDNLNPIKNSLFSLLTTGSVVPCPASLASKTAVSDWQVKCELELALKPRAERNAAASATALAEAVQKAEQVLALCTCEGVLPDCIATSDKEREAVECLTRLVRTSKGRLAEEAAEQVRASIPYRS